MDNYSRNYGTYQQAHQEYGYPDDGYSHHDVYEASGVSTANSGVQEDYDMYDDDVDELLNDIARSSPSPPDRSHRSRSQLLTSSQYRPITQQPDYQPLPPPRRYEDTRAMYAQEPSEYQIEAPPDLPNPYRSQTRLNAGPAHTDISYHNVGYDDDSATHYRDTATTGPVVSTRAYKDQPAQPETRNWHGTRLRPVSDLPDMYRSLFKFGVFNAVQSQCYDTVMNTDDNMVISAPTGSGKTVLFELAIIRMLKRSSITNEKARCVYIAPTKSLCTEKSSSWESKFTPFGAKCSELTGDTVHSGKGAWGDAKDATIIVSTGEKWDSLTRNWQDHDHILSQIQLFLIDEVHLLNESRGSTLEVVVSRMKLRGNAVRFIVVSATVPNVVDVADWIGNHTNNGPAVVKEFGEEFRPCKLSRFVYGVPRRRDTNDFVFAKALDYRLYAILQQHCHDKPVLVFCATRKGVLIAAEHILKEYEEATSKKETLPWSKPPRIEHNFSNKQLDKLAAWGIGVHHAGLTREDRSATERLYLKKALKVLFATSTLAVGVNLPAHTVIIKGVKLFQNGSSQEYSDLDVMQMIGRAGRPQFDKEGIAIIMCEQELESKYKALAQGQTVLESSLHLHLPEHLNSEIALGTITDMETAKAWIHSSFLFRRLRKNPGHYDVKKEGDKSWEERMDDLVTDSVKTLKSAEMVKNEDEDALTSTEYGDIMSKFYIRQATMILILKLSEKATVREILETLSCADEFSDIKFRAGEKQVYNKLRTHMDIRYTLKKIEKPSDKVFILIQAILGAINLSDPEYKAGETQPYTESLPILRHISRIARAVVEVAIMRKAGMLVKNALEVMRCLNAKAWEDRSVVFRQLNDIGLKSLKVLAEHNITTFAALRRMDPGLIESYLNRKPPFGHELLASVNQLPQYSVQITEIDVTPREDGVEVELSIDCSLLKDTKAPKAKKNKKQRRWDMTMVLTLTSDHAFVDFRRIPTAALKESRSFEVSVKLTKPSQTIVVYMTSDVYAGLTVSATYKPKVSATAFPIMDTRPQDALARDLEGLEDMPDFWDMTSDDEVVRAEDDEPLPEKGKTATEQKLRPDTMVKPAGAASAATAAPKQLPNGNYECNHACKDKNKCRHLCCREGLAKPPPITKKRIEMLIAAERSPQSLSSSVKADEDNNDKQPKPKPKPRPKDGSLKRLEALHERMGVEKSLQLGDGSRIKLKNDLAAQSKPSRKPVPNFDIEFSQVADPPTATAARDLPDVSDSDSDLHEPDNILELLKGPAPEKKAASSDSADYANSEFDALIADLPLDSACATKAYDTGSSDAMDWTPASSSHKRKQASPRSSPQPKRTKYARSSSPPIEVASSPARTPREEPLFEPPLSDEAPLPGFRARSSPATSPGPGLVDDEEGFTLDESLFDIMPSTPTLSEASYVPHVEPPRNAFDWEPRRRAVEATVDEAPKTVDRAEDTSELAKEAGTDMDDPLAELEAWLQSGAVEFEE